MDSSSDDEAGPATLPGRTRGARDLRRSIFSLNPSTTSRAAAEVDLDDDDSDHSPDHVLAKRLQDEEYADASVDSLKQDNERRTRSSQRSSLKSTPISTPASTTSGLSTRRAREETSSINSGPPAKRARGMTSLPSEPGPTAARGQRAQLPSSDVSSRPRRRANPSFLPASQLLQYGSSLPRPTSLSDLTGPSSGAGVSDNEGALSVPSVDSPLTVPDSSGDDDEISRAPVGSSRRRRERARRQTAPDFGVGASDNEDAMSLSSVDSQFTVPDSSGDDDEINRRLEQASRERRGFRNRQTAKAAKKFRSTLEKNHPQLLTLWEDLEKKPLIRAGQAPQPPTIHRRMKPFQLEGLAWMKQMETSEYKGGILGDEMGLGKTIQAVSLIMSDFPAGKPSLVLVPPVALMQWVAEIDSYTDKALKTFVFHGTNQDAKSMTAHQLKKYDVIMMSYNSLESMYRQETKGRIKKKNSDDGTMEVHKKASLIHKIDFHRIILDEAHGIKTRNTSTAKACFALQGTYRWCLTGTPLQNVIGEYFSLIQFLGARPFSGHSALSHICVFNQEILSPIQKYGRQGPGARAFDRLLLLTDHIMLRRLKKNHTESMELPVKELQISRQFFSESENETVTKVTEDARRTFESYVMDGRVLENYANIFSLIMQLRQTADHADLITKKHAQGNQNILECCICESPAEDAIASKCHHHFCRACARNYLDSIAQPECPRCHVPLAVDITQPEIEQDQLLLKKTSIVNRIQMENWTSSTKIELLVHELYQLRSQSATHKSIIFSQFTSMLQLIEWRLRHAGFTTVMLDGSMTPAQRDASIKHFMNNVDVECFLVSLKAGGVALNLTEASRVFLVEPWWNPAVEWQSADRCHRIGQARPCIIKNLVVEDSVESRMVLLQEKKTMMIHSTMNKDNKAAQSLSPRDMQFLFRGV
ncbi:related to nucleotide exsicion repair protein RAD16 [Cephalotrichum gorgonifer]|uniref:Related to nucleotide exsicion repair protein RAD16 n=1 Tax=Cephalotrichum gorgonifer TaxID=2041049 RepID=A0AAE8SR17_9PEZI|nr:related to nucleotide exsicion repair protein RAD16 [Cephalotrichum gorgonifer]